MSSTYGAAFDRLVRRWAATEARHDKRHPDRSLCPGVEICEPDRTARDLERELIAELADWRERRQRQRTTNADTVTRYGITRGKNRPVVHLVLPGSSVTCCGYAVVRIVPEVGKRRQCARCLTYAIPPAPEGKP